MQLKNAKKDFKHLILNIFFWRFQFNKTTHFIFETFMIYLLVLINTLVILFTMAYLLCFINSWLENSAVIMYSLYSYSNTESSHTMDLPE